MKVKYGYQYNRTVRPSPSIVIPTGQGLTEIHADFISIKKPET